MHPGAVRRFALAPCPCPATFSSAPCAERHHGERPWLHGGHPNPRLAAEADHCSLRLAHVNLRPILHSDRGAWRLALRSEQVYVPGAARVFGSISGMGVVHAPATATCTVTPSITGMGNCTLGDSMPSPTATCGGDFTLDDIAAHNALPWSVAFNATDGTCSSYNDAGARPRHAAPQ